MKVSVIGSGGWGTALALVLLENGHEVYLWSYTGEESAVLRETRENPMLKGVPLPETLELTTDLNCVNDALFIAAGIHMLRDAFARKDILDFAHGNHTFPFLGQLVKHSYAGGLQRKIMSAGRSDK